MYRRHFLQLAVASLVARSGHALASEEQSVSFLNWNSYIGSSTLSDFNSATGISVNYGLFADNYELFSKLRTSPGQYDLITPSNVLVDLLIQADMVAPIDKTQLSHWENIDPAFHDCVFDPGRNYSVPYTNGALAVGYRRSAIAVEPTTWADIFLGKQSRGKLAIPDDSVLAMQLAFKALGIGVNDWSEKALAEAEQLLTSLKPHLVAFTSVNGQDLLLAGEADIVVEHDGPLIQAQAEDSDLEILYPAEGTVIWEDVLCILKDSQNIDNAHALIDYLLRGEVAADIATDIGYAMANTKAQKLLGARELSSSVGALNRPRDEKDEYGRFPGQEVLADIEKRWLRIKLS